MLFKSRPAPRIPFKLAAVASLSLLVLSAKAAPTATPASTAPYGIEFNCPAVSHRDIVGEAIRYFNGKGIKPQWLEVVSDLNRNSTTVRLAPAMALPSTTGISRAKQFEVSADLVDLLDPRRQVKQVPTVSQKEILLALLHPGRVTGFEGKDCGVEALQDEVGVRQTVSAWAQTLEFGWPEGASASWNETYWDRGTPKTEVNLHDALTDMLIAPSRYEVGCYTAAKAVISAATLDYYTRIKQDRVKGSLVQAALMRDGDPLVNVEPGETWRFEEDHDSADDAIQGKLLDIRRGVGAGSIVPGDWIYFLNSDPVTYQKTGYEGSNALYLGLDRFSDYYNDHEHSFSFKQKLNEVYQWRNKVFSRTRDADKVVPLTDSDYSRLSNTPEEGGLLLDFRLVPKVFPR